MQRNEERRTESQRHSNTPGGDKAEIGNQGCKCMWWLDRPPLTESAVDSSENDR